MVAQDRYPRPENIQKLAERLCELGYWPVPIPAGCKGPTTAGWQNLRLTADRVADYFNETGMLIGVLHTNVLALDIDVYDSDLSKQIITEAARRFPGALERIGEAPKSALFFRMEEPGFKIHSTRKYEKADTTAQLEVRSATRQIVVYGKHPATQRPYTWPKGELWSTPWGSLPLAKQPEIEQFRDWTEDLLRKWAGVKDTKIIDLGLYSGRTFDTGDKPTPEQFIDYLNHIPSNLAYKDWLDVLMGTHDFFSGSLAGLEAAKNWSSDYQKYTPEEVEKKWRSFEPGKGISFKTVLHFAKQNGADIRRRAEFRIDTGPSDTRFGAEEADSDEETAEGPAKDAEDEPSGTLEWYRNIKPALGSSYIIKGVLDSHALSAIYGPSNSGKTFFALDLAFHIATGRTWRGFRIRKAAVLYLAAEGGRGVQNRIAAIRKHTGVDDVPIALRRAGLDLLRSQADLQAVYDLSQETKKIAGNDSLVIVIDTLSRAMAGGDENSPVDMTALIKNVDMIREATGAHVMLVHHTGKDTARGARGHSSLRAALDTEIEVQAEDNWRAALVTKQRDNASGQEFPFTLHSVSLGVDDDGDEVTSCVIESANTEEVEARRRTRGLGGNQKIIADTFDQMLAEGLGKPNPGGVGFPDPGMFWCVGIDDLRNIVRGKMVAADTRSAFNQAFRILSGERGIFVTGGNVVWRVDRPCKRGS